MVGIVLYEMVGLFTSIASSQRHRARLPDCVYSIGIPPDSTGRAGLRGTGGRVD